MKRMESPGLEMNSEVLLARTFLGSVVPYEQRSEWNEITKAKIKILDDLGFKTSDLYLAGGLINLATDPPLDLLDIKEYIVKRAHSMLSDSYMQENIEVLFSIYNALLDKLQAAFDGDITHNISLIVGDLESIEAQLGTLLLPSSTMVTVRDPLTFAQRTAPLLGRYLIAIFLENLCE